MMLKLEQKTNVILDRLQQAKKEGRKIYIYGYGEMGRIVERALKDYNISIEAFCIDAAFYNENIVGNIPVLSIEQVISSANQAKRPIVVIAFRDYNAEKLEQLEQFVDIINKDVFSFHTVNNRRDAWGNTFFEEYSQKLSEIYDMLSDDKSRETMVAFLYQKMTGKLEYLENIYQSNQYYDRDIINFEKIHTYVDCGAYDGDSFLAFVDNYKKNTGKVFEEKAYLLEPDERNFKKLVVNCSLYKNCSFCKAGAWSERKTLVFSSEGTFSGVTDYGDITIEADTIDNLTMERADFIKMDIEGSELEALRGAENTIRKCHPILAICVYHKCDDLWVIPEYIYKLDSTYCFYLRAYSKYSQELVLYAI